MHSNLDAVYTVTLSSFIFAHSYGTHRSWLSPRNAVTSVGVTVPCAVARAAAVFTKPPVSHHAAVAARAPDTGLTGALPAGRAAERATT